MVGLALVRIFKPQLSGVLQSKEGELRFEKFLKEEVGVMKELGRSCRFYGEFVRFIRNVFFRANPVLGLASPKPWRVELLKELNRALSEFAPYYVWGKLREWALVENLSESSHFTRECPLNLTGSARWQARDGGGRYKILKEKVLEAISDARNPYYAVKPHYALLELEGMLYILGEEADYPPVDGDDITMCDVVFGNNIKKLLSLIWQKYQEE